MKRKKPSRAARGKQGGRGHKKPLDLNPDPGVSKREPSQDFLAVHAITRMAEAAGWRPRQAFMVGMQMHIAGVTVAGAAQMFADAERRVQ
jgi:hypothetical protein